MNCTTCTKELNPESNQNKFCSRKCFYESMKGPGSRVKTCVECNSEYPRKHHYTNATWAKSKYCSLDCNYKNTSLKKGHQTWNKGLEGYMAGEKNSMWKGGITPLVRKLRASTAMKLWRKAIFERDNYACGECGNRGGKLNAHHVKHFSTYPELRFIISNGMTLCESCHENQHENSTFTAKLSEHQVKRIRLIKELTPQITLKKLGSMFGVADYTIGDILRGATWKWVT